MHFFPMLPIFKPSREFFFALATFYYIFFYHGVILYPKGLNIKFNTQNINIKISISIKSCSHKGCFNFHCLNLFLLIFFITTKYPQNLLLH